MFPTAKAFALLAAALAGLALAQAGTASALVVAKRYHGPTSIETTPRKIEIPKICKNSISRSFEGYTAKKCN
jgi:hypothetical protein